MSNEIRITVDEARIPVNEVRNSMADRARNALRSVGSFAYRHPNIAMVASTALSYLGTAIAMNAFPSHQTTIGLIGAPLIVIGMSCSFISCTISAARHMYHHPRAAIIALAAASAIGISAMTSPTVPLFEMPHALEHYETTGTLLMNCAMQAVEACPVVVSYYMNNTDSRRGKDGNLLLVRGQFNPTKLIAEPRGPFFTRSQTSSRIFHDATPSCVVANDGALTKKMQERVINAVKGLALLPMSWQGVLPGESKTYFWDEKEAQVACKPIVGAYSLEEVEADLDRVLGSTDL